MDATFSLTIKLDSKGKKEFTLTEEEARELQTKLNALFGETKYVPYTPYVPVFPTWYKRKPFPYDYYTITCNSSDGSDNIVYNSDNTVRNTMGNITLENNTGKVTY